MLIPLKVSHVLFYFQFYPFPFCILQELSLLAASFLIQMVLYEAILKRELRFPNATRQHSNCKKLGKKSSEELGIFLMARNGSAVLVCVCDLTEAFTKLPQEHQASRTSFRPLLAAAFFRLKNHTKFSSSVFLQLLHDSPKLHFDLNERNTPNLSGYTSYCSYGDTWVSSTYQEVARFVTIHGACGGQDLCVPP